MRIFSALLTPINSLPPHPLLPTANKHTKTKPPRPTSSSGLPPSRSYHPDCLLSPIFIAYNLFGILPAFAKPHPPASALPFL